jgi:type IV secretion system protein TrbL
LPLTAKLYPRLADLMDDLAIIDRFTETFSRYIDSGFGLLAGDVAFLTSVLVAMDITLAGLFWALVGEDNLPAQLIRKVLYVGFFALLLNNFKGLADIVFQSFAGLGLKASGASLTAADLMRPGFVASTGFTASRPLLEKAGELIGLTSFFTNFVTIVVLMLAWLIVLLAFFVLSVQLFITIIEFKLTVLAGFVLVPFALFGQTAFLAERVLGNVISAGIKLMVLAIVVGIGATLFGTLIRPSGEITLTQAVSTILAAIAVFGLAVFVPGLAAGLVSGAPQLGAGAAVATGIALGGTAVAGGMLASGAARLTGRATGGSLKAAAALTGRVSAAYEAGGPRGVARTTITAPATRLIAAGTAPVRDAYRLGAAQGYRDAEPPEAGDPDRGADALGSGGSRTEPPVWARNLARRQRLTQAGLMAAGAVREGDRPVAGSSPDLKDKS